MVTISCHQPNFFPWYPFFQKMEQSDIFVILNHVQFEKNGYQNRFKMNDEWFTMQVGHGLKPIIEKKYIDWKTDWRKIKTRLLQYDLSVFDDTICRSLFVTNNNLIFKIMDLLNIKTEMDDDTHIKSKGTQRLVDICKKFGATKYLSGISGKKYLDLKLFDKAKIEVVFQDEIQMIKKPILEVLYD